jgi:hypothetical protein
MCPQEFKIKGSSPLLQPRSAWDPKPWQTMKEVALLCPYSAQAGFSRQDGAKFLTKSCFAVKMQIREGKMMLGFPLPCPIPRSFPAPGSG